MIKLILSLCLLSGLGFSQNTCDLPDSTRNQNTSPYRLGPEYVPLTQETGFHVVYSTRGPSSQNPTAYISYNVLISIFKLQEENSVLIFGSGYGNHNVSYRNVEDDVDDVEKVFDCLGVGDCDKPVKVYFVAPHGHLDHINPEFLKELQNRGHQIMGIWFHRGDESLISRMNWQSPTLRDLFRVLDGKSPCNKELVSFNATLGKIWFKFRGEHHTPGGLDLVLDFAPTKSLVVLGTKPGGLCQTWPPNVGNFKIKAHTNVKVRWVIQ